MFFVSESTKLSALNNVLVEKRKQNFIPTNMNDSTVLYNPV